jgi:DNA-binding transcriptional ArsR family regulator
MPDSELVFLKRISKATEDPRLMIYYILLERRRDGGTPALSRKTLLQATRLTERTVDRTLRWLTEENLVDKIRGRSETYYFAT